MEVPSGHLALKADTDSLAALSELAGLRSLEVDGLAAGQVEQLALALGGGTTHHQPAADSEELEVDLFEDTPPAIGVRTCEPEPPASAEPAGEETEASSLRSLSILRSPGLPGDAWSPLWQALPRSLTHLDLSHNALNDHAVSALCGALRLREVRLARLGLQGNRCKDIQRLANFLAEGGVEVLDFADNALNDKSIWQLCEVLTAQSCRLQELCLNDNRRLSSKSLTELFKLLPRTPLRSLALRRTSLCEAGVQGLRPLRLQHLDLAGLKLSLGLAQDLLAEAEASSFIQGLVLDVEGQRISWRRFLATEALPEIRAAAMAEKREASAKLLAAERCLKVGKAEESLKESTAALEIFRSLGADGESALPDVFRLIIDGKRQVDLPAAEQFAETEKSNFAKAGNKRGEAAMLISIAEVALSRCGRPGAGSLPSVKPLEQAAGSWAGRRTRAFEAYEREILLLRNRIAKKDQAGVTGCQELTDCHLECARHKAIKRDSTKMANELHKARTQLQEEQDRSKEYKAQAEQYKAQTEHLKGQVDQLKAAAGVERAAASELKELKTRHQAELEELQKESRSTGGTLWRS
ncbi:unnamed protein product [Effrenium voratum]|uniref:Uncharacterized protein n=1 Tax=Effrenium voratum TaxID=2562239 RepID=A0AA36ISS7_9DINO|nr:unnamed protein product [Effrenium voratum]